MSITKVLAYSLIFSLVLSSCGGSPSVDTEEVPPIITEVGSFYVNAGLDKTVYNSEVVVLNGEVSGLNALNKNLYLIHI